MHSDPDRFSERPPDPSPWRKTMQPRRQHGTAELRKAPRKTSEASNRFADETLRLENQKLRELNSDLELRLASRTKQLTATNRIKDELLARERTAREAAETSNLVKSDFLALLSHEFRTPLQAVFGYTELLDADIHGELNESQRLYVHRIKQSQQHLLGLINTILEFAKLESGQLIDVVLCHTPMNEILQFTESLIAPQLDAKDLAYAYRSADESIAAYADTTKVQQIVLNLLSNAIKFTQPGGSITLECVREPEMTVLHVHDTGRGIPPDQLDAVFEPFVQVKMGGSVSNGTGLGLSISRRLAQAMGGSLTAVSELGKGSTFTLRLQSASALT